MHISVAVRWYVGSCPTGGWASLGGLGLVGWVGLGWVVGLGRLGWVWLGGFS